MSSPPLRKLFPPMMGIGEVHDPVAVKAFLVIECGARTETVERIARDRAARDRQLRTLSLARDLVNDNGGVVPHVARDRAISEG